MAEWICSCGKYNTSLFTLKCAQCGLRHGQKTIPIPKPIDQVVAKSACDCEPLLKEIREYLNGGDERVIEALYELTQQNKEIVELLHRLPLVEQEPEVELSQEEIDEAVAELKRSKKEDLKKKKKVKA